TAVADHRFPGRIALHVLILAEGSQQISKGLLGNIFRDDRFAERNENRMGWATVVAIVEFALPPIQQLESTLFLRHFVAEVVRPAAISVDIVKMLMQILGEQPGDYVEIFVVVSSEPARVPLRLGIRALIRRG